MICVSNRKLTIRSSGTPTRSAPFSSGVQGVARVPLVRRVLLGSAPPPFQTLAAAAFGHPPVSSWRTAAGTHGRLLARTVGSPPPVGKAAIWG
jgi:hypothetical protein